MELTGKENSLNIKNNIDEFEDSDLSQFNFTDLINELNLISKKLNLPDNLNILQFLTEMSECYNNSTSTSGKMTNGTIIKTDYGCIEDFFEQIIAELIFNDLNTHSNNEYK